MHCNSEITFHISEIIRETFSGPEEKVHCVMAAYNTKSVKNRPSWTQFSLTYYTQSNPSKLLKVFHLEPKGSNAYLKYKVNDHIN